VVEDAESTLFNVVGDAEDEHTRTMSTIESSLAPVAPVGSSVRMIRHMRQQTVGASNDRWDHGAIEKRAASLCKSNNREGAVHEFQLGQRLELLDAMLPSKMVHVVEDQVDSNIRLYSDLFGDLRRRKMLRYVLRMLLHVRIFRSWASWALMKRKIRMLYRTTTVNLTLYRWHYHVMGGVRLQRIMLGPAMQKLPVVRASAFDLWKFNAERVAKAERMRHARQRRQKKYGWKKWADWMWWQKYFDKMCKRRFMTRWHEQAHLKRRTRRLLFKVYACTPYSCTMRTILTILMHHTHALYSYTIQYCAVQFKPVWMKLPMVKRQAFDMWRVRILWFSRVRELVLGPLFSRLPMIRGLAFRVWLINCEWVRKIESLRARSQRAEKRKRWAMLWRHTHSVLILYSYCTHSVLILY
jgi:hypothetical protein